MQHLLDPMVVFGQCISQLSFKAGKRFSALTQLFAQADVSFFGQVGFLDGVAIFGEPAAGRRLPPIKLFFKHGAITLGFFRALRIHRVVDLKVCGMAEAKE